MHLLRGRKSVWVLIALIALGSEHRVAAQVAGQRPPASPNLFINWTGQWESLQWNLDTWVIDLKASEGMLTGSVSVIPGAGRTNPSAAKPVEIFDGKATPTGMEFKAKSPDGMRLIQFSGTRTRAGVQFTRK